MYNKSLLKQRLLQAVSVKENDCSYSCQSYTWQCNASMTKHELEDVSLETNLGFPLYSLLTPFKMNCKAVLMYQVDGEGERMNLLLFLHSLTSDP